MPECSDLGLTKFMKQKIDINHQEAIKIKRAKLVSNPYRNGNVISEYNTITIGVRKYEDTGGGFLIEKNLEIADYSEVAQTPIFKSDFPTCEVCNMQFATSWLFDNFTLKCCDTCRNPERHTLVTKTESKDIYLLRDCDLDRREPPLKFIRQNNPYNDRWGDMKLYLQIQVEERALEVWGSEEKLEEEKQHRKDKRMLAKSKKYQKHLIQLKKGMRSSLYNFTTAASHSHEFGPETYNEEEDVYHHECTVCPYEESFEKM